MARQHFTRSRANAPQRRLTQWIGPALQNYQTVATAGATVIASVPFNEKTTIVRTRGHCSVIPTVVTADLNIIGAVGFGIVSSEALAIGVTAIPEPFTDADWSGWFVWRSYSYRLEVVSEIGEHFIEWDFEVDSKAMRKVGPNESAVIVAESFAGEYQISCPWRMLVKLS